MPGRTLLFVVVLVIAVVGPYLLSEQGLLPGSAPRDAAANSSTSVWDRLFSSKGAAPANAAATQTAPVARQDPLPGRIVPRQSIGGPAGITLAEALRFDITPAWVADNWARVTTQLTDTDYLGLRVPLVTGTEPHDVAGSLSYYFNAQNQLQRVTLVGYTGDFEPLVTLVQSTFGLQQYASVGPGLFLGYLGPNPVAVLRLENAMVQAADQPHTRYRLELELNVPKPGAKLSAEMMSKLQRLREGRLL